MTEAELKQTWAEILQKLFLKCKMKIDSGSVDCQKNVCFHSALVVFYFIRYQFLSYSILRIIHAGPLLQTQDGNCNMVK